ncbi:hypothetical protein E2F46_15275 [Luteimonas aestuarii]|uniref:XAC0095-like domain-containing protein n=1 Tax=Luteimonas aestuarii TaxID=453837 RepID=A0A4R5TSV9_9GAMM|nr:hypothetical protein [Luteimonas aestuarii]TDK21059.1 hypothetical protein E2F46_15275 [Luteimonas aestuarii]
MPMGYVLPEQAHLALLQLRDHLRLLARLTEPAVVSGDEEIPVSPEALAQCFERMARDLDGVLAATTWPHRRAG